jgi:uncharacterized membrane protein YhaH (DUF805 family)
MILAATGVVGWPELVAISYLATIIFGVALARRIARKAGYSPAWGFIMLAPFINLIALWVFAFSRWPICGAPAVLGEAHGQSMTKDP